MPVDDETMVMLEALVRHRLLVERRRSQRAHRKGAIITLLLAVVLAAELWAYATPN